MAKIKNMQDFESFMIEIGQWKFEWGQMKQVWEYISWYRIVEKYKSWCKQREVKLKAENSKKPNKTK